MKIDAWVAELVDARDLKSLGVHPPCRFKSGPRHHINQGLAIQRLKSRSSGRVNLIEVLSRSRGKPRRSSPCRPKHQLLRPLDPASTTWDDTQMFQLTLAVSKDRLATVTMMDQRLMLLQNSSGRTEGDAQPTGIQGAENGQSEFR